MNKILLLIILILAVIGSVFFWRKPIQTNIGPTLKIGDTIINLEIASDDKAREKGLSGRESLEAERGLLFVFPISGYYQFWMKDMLFPIDIAWFDQNKKIIYIAQNISPETYPKSFGPKQKSQYVLEVNAGFFANHQIKIGDQAEF